MKNEEAIFIYREAILRITFAIAVLLMAGGTSAGAVTNISACGIYKDKGYFGAPSKAVTNISACGILISSPGEYVLNASITNSGGTNCININSSNVVFDGAGYTIDGSGIGANGVFVSNFSTTLTNVTITNLTATNWYNIGIYYNNTANGSITNNNASSNRFADIEVDFSSNITLNGNDASWIVLSSSNSNNLIGNDARLGIYLNSSNSNNLIGNDASSGFGIYLYSSNSNNLSGNNASGNNAGNVINNVTILSPTGGIFLDSSNSNNLSGNNASFSGIFLFSAFSISNSNNLSRNDAGSIEMLCNSNNNTLSGNTAGSGGISLLQSSNNMLSGNNVSFGSNPSFFPPFIGFCSFAPNISIQQTGIFLFSSNNNMLVENNISNFFIQSGKGIFLAGSIGNNLSSNSISNNTYGILLSYSSNNNLLTNNNVSNNNYGINITSSSNNTIYNNYFNNTLNAADDSNNTWNITKQLGTNILGGPYLGGNFWSDYAGNDTDGDRIGDTLIPYNSSGNILNGGDYLPLTVILGVTLTVNAGNTVTTNTTGTGTSTSNPVVTSVTTPNAGTVSIQETPATQNSSTGFYFLGQQVNITAPPANSSSPLNISFQINSSQIPSGQNANTIQILKNGVVVNGCTAISPISPDPCVSNRATLSNGDVEITVLTSTASNWQIAIPTFTATIFTATKDFRFTNVKFTATPAQLGTLLPQNGSKYNVTYVIKPKGGTVSSTNPGQLYGVITVNGTGVANVTVNDSFGTQFKVHPAHLDGGVEVLRVNATTGDAVVITDTPQVTSATVSAAGPVNLTINLTTPLARDEKLMIYIKFETALRGKLPNTNDFVNAAVVTTNLGIPQTATATINFV